MNAWWGRERLWKGSAWLCHALEEAAHLQAETSRKPDPLHVPLLHREAAAVMSLLSLFAVLFSEGRDLTRGPVP
jgi:hypothetical protein